MGNKGEKHENYEEDVGTGREKPIVVSITHPDGTVEMIEGYCIAGIIITGGEGTRVASSSLLAGEFNNPRAACVFNHYPDARNRLVESYPEVALMDLMKRSTDSIK